ncbi:MAG: Mov34/MPN/PAD-1 family protein [Acidibacillus sp.]|nr:Mov34/MPN/PAD-1 family protein [Acidibacillus sp.]
MEREGHRSSFESRPQVSLDAAVLAQIKAHVTQRLPFESGGLLIGKQEYGKFLVESFLPLEAAMPSQNRYIARASDTVRSIIRIHYSGKRVIGTIHSHPEGSDIPSSIDLDGAYGYENMVHMIAYPLAGQLQCSAFRYYIGDSSHAAPYYERVEVVIDV